MNINFCKEFSNDSRHEMERDRRTHARIDAAPSLLS